MPRLISVNVGLPADVPWAGRTVHTGIWKSPVDGPVRVRRLNLDGDGQGDLAGHGGEQRAVLVYQLDSYRYWQQYLERPDLPYGQFGENFTVDGLADVDVCIGDRYRIGTAEFEVTQPRVTCFRLGIRLGVPEMAALFVAHRRPGFYLRVLQEGEVRAGDEIVQTRAEPHRQSVADVDGLLYLPNRSVERLRAVIDIAALSPGWQQSFRDLLDESGADGSKPTDEPGWAGFRRLRVERVVPESATITSVYLGAPKDEPLTSPRAGQYVTVRLPEAGDPAPVRSYSVSSAPDATTYRISVKREDHGVLSGYVHSRLRPGALVDVAAPRGEFVLDDGDGPVLLLSAGVGVTPVLAMLHRLAAEKSARAVWWMHVTRDAAHHAFADEARRLLTSLPRAHERIVYTGPDGRPSPDGRVTVGRPTARTLAEFGVPSDATAYVCGPPAFMSDMQQALTAVGITAARIRRELFGALPPVNPGVTDVRDVRPHQPSGPAGTGVEVTFARSGLTVRWSTDRRSLLDLADACDVPTRFACRTGVCHTCVTAVLAGQVTYSPTPLEPPGEGTALICCAQPAGDVVLDL